VSASLLRTGILRSILGRYPMRDSAYLRFHYNACGNPTLRVR
jgi:hypothetical protein